MAMWIVVIWLLAKGIGNWQLIMGIGYWLLTIDYGYWLVIGYGYMAMVIDYMDRVSLAFYGLGLGQVLCKFECVVFWVLGLHFKHLGLRSLNMV
jgi:hypothetical protein